MNFTIYTQFTIKYLLTFLRQNGLSLIIEIYIMTLILKKTLTKTSKKIVNKRIKLVAPKVLIYINPRLKHSLLYTYTKH